MNIDKEILLTQLANVRVIKEVGQKLGYIATGEQIKEILNFVKEKAYKLNRSTFPESEIVEIFKKFGGK